MFEKVRSELLELTRVKLQKSVTKDVLIIQSSLVLEDIQQSLQALSMRFREWYENYNPELSKKEHDQEKFVREAIKQERKSPTAGGKFSKEDYGCCKLAINWLEFAKLLVIY